MNGENQKQKYPRDRPDKTNMESMEPMTGYKTCQSQ